MDMGTVLVVAALILVAAMLYSSVGHAGASGYLAVMALFRLAPEVMRPTALVLNIFVAAIGTVKFYRAGWFTWRLFWPFVLTSAPMAFMGGRVVLPTPVYKAALGAVLLGAACRLAFVNTEASPVTVRPLPVWVGLPLGAVIGLFAGLTGVGGGIFLSPLLLLMRWAEVRRTAAVSAAFILVNSVSGLLGQLSIVASVPQSIALWAPAAAVGGWIGAEFGSRRLGTVVIRRLLALVLAIAGVSMLRDAVAQYPLATHSDRSAEPRRSARCRSSYSIHAARRWRSSRH